MAHQIWQRAADDASTSVPGRVGAITPHRYRSGRGVDRRGAGMRIRNDRAAGLPEPRSSSVRQTDELLERHQRESRQLWKRSRALIPPPEGEAIEGTA
jgi:hypothetical protein